MPVRKNLLKNSEDTTSLSRSKSMPSKKEHIYSEATGGPTEVHYYQNMSIFNNFMTKQAVKNPKKTPVYSLPNKNRNKVFDETVGGYIEEESRNVDNEKPFNYIAFSEFLYGERKENDGARNKPGAVSFV